MNRKSFFIIIVFILLLLWYLIQPTTEGFAQCSGWGLPLRSKTHVVVHTDGDPISYSYLPPHQNGRYGCTQVPCPHTYDDDFVCWSCDCFH